MSLKAVLGRAAQLEHVEHDEVRRPPLDVIAFSVAVTRKLRNWKKLTLADFARVSLSTVERVERGEPVTDEALNRIAGAFGYAAGHYTTPRTTIPREEVEAEIKETYGNLVPVKVARFTGQVQVREASRCCAYLMHAPNLPDAYSADIENLREYLDLVSFCLAEQSDGTPMSDTARRPLYEHTLGAVRELERRGVTVLIGYLDAPQPNIPDWRVCIVSLTSRLIDPGAPKRKMMFIDKRIVAIGNTNLGSID
ncbi:MAG: hypothetical protein GY873_21970 [Bosea sp.]|uniref:hypothetical protein n=1 Tax=Bosea sp. (in: a-proteobacteria) TaxID=1871050 RepID=UPI00238BBDDA|nr:hypothetical protein [Bosea sp. (in: a-proteobacteria)]MCP4736859.1 hypothetical protein [Bosea sp. (in: a-proteobacteria)]